MIEENLCARPSFGKGAMPGCHPAFNNSQRPDRTQRFSRLSVPRKGNQVTEPSDARMSALFGGWVEHSAAQDKIPQSPH
jgi:hypothetical protein